MKVYNSRGIEFDTKDIQVPKYEGKLPWYWINPNYNFISWKSENEIGQTRNFLKTYFDDSETIETRLRELIAGFDRYSFEAYLPYID